MTSLTFYFSIILLSCWGCVNTERGKAAVNSLVRNDSLVNQTPYHIQLPENGDSRLNVSFIADSINYVPLETKPESLLRRVKQVRMNDSIIAVSDMLKILLFRRDGTFIRQIGRRGKGPGEYGYINGFQLIEDTVYLTSSSKRSVLKYALDGEYHGEKILGRNMVYFTKDNQNKLIWYNSQEGEIYFLDSNLNITDTRRVERNVSTDRYRYLITDLFNVYFQVSKEKVLFTNYMTDTIWNISGGRHEAEYVFNLKEKLLPWKKQIEYSGGDFVRYEKEATSYQRINVAEIADYLFVTQRNWSDKIDGIHTLYIHCFRDNETRKFTLPFFNDDVLGHINLRVRGALSTEDAFITAIEATELLESLEKLNREAPLNDVRHQAWRTSVSKIKYDDNPVLVIIKPRK